MVVWYFISHYAANKLYTMQLFITICVCVCVCVYMYIYIYILYIRCWISLSHLSSLTIILSLSQSHSHSLLHSCSRSHSLAIMLEGVPSRTCFPDRESPPTNGKDGGRDVGKFPPRRQRWEPQTPAPLPTLL